MPGRSCSETQAARASSKGAAFHQASALLAEESGRWHQPAFQEGTAAAPPFSGQGPGSHLTGHRLGESPEEAAAQPDGGWAQVSGDDTAPAGGSGTGPVAPRARSGALSRSSPFSDDGSVSLEDTGASAGRYHYSAFSSPNPFMSDDEISPAPPAESPAAAPDETQSGDAAEPPEDGHDAADQVPPEHDGQGAEKSNVFGYEEGWYQKGLEEERRRKEEAEAKERNEVPCTTDLPRARRKDSRRGTRMGLPLGMARDSKADTTRATRPVLLTGRLRLTPRRRSSPRSRRSSESPWSS